ncbi:MAG: hypothetical protein VB102_07785 [Paludibacter sp.]|nr:hypothetical protein [Paludibacter sp.]
MKKLGYFLLTIVMMGLVACENNISETVTYKINEPVFMDMDAFRSSVKVKSEVHELTGYGKICYYNGYLYMSEPGKGIHIINNQDPAHPQVVGYIELLGNADLSIRNNLLYADSYIDLVWFDVTNPAQPQLSGRLENVFPEAIPMIENGLGVDYMMSYGEERKDKVIVGWKEVERTESVKEYNGGGFFWRWFGGDVVSVAEKQYDSSTGGNSVNGSMSRFTIYQNYLYVVLNNQMSVFDLSKTQPEKAVENIYVGWNVETIFSYKNYMYMGTPTGMLIYSVEKPLEPKQVSSIQHVFGCDPVVVEDDIAYVTIHSGNNCGQNTNELIIIDVKDPAKPKQLVSYGMTKPKGLGIDHKTLFVCDEGLKVYNAANPLTIMANELARHEGMEGYDVIPFNNVLMMIAEDGIYQYDYSDIQNIKPLSFLPVANDSIK